MRTLVSAITIDQELFVKKLTQKFLLGKRHARTTPCDPIAFQKLKPADNDLDRDRASRLPYLQLIGSLLYLSTMTRPDIAYHMSVLCSLMHDHTVEAYEAALDLLSYVQSTSDTQIRFSGSSEAPDSIEPALRQHIQRNHGLLAYSDAAWHKPDKLGYNMFGYVIYLYGGPICFAAKRMKVVAISSAEAEYAGAAFTCKEIVFVRNICKDLGIQLHGHTALAVDNQAAIKIARNMGVTARNKHFEDTLHFFRHMVDHRIVDPFFVTTRNQKADGFTKPLAPSLYGPWRRTVVHVVE